MSNRSNARTRGMFRVAQALAICTCVFVNAGCIYGCIYPQRRCAASQSCVQSAHTPPSGQSGQLPHVDHIVIVIEENRSYDEIIGSAQAPYINALASRGALFTNAHAVTHPSQPNYLALFAGSTFGITSDACPLSLSGPNLASELLNHALTFASYSEDLPQTGYTGCHSGGTPVAPLYVRKHSPWTNFANVPASANQPLSSFPADFSHLPAVAFVVPNEQHDMHSGSIAAADLWLQERLDAYARWALLHDSLLIVTWDEDDRSSNNHIPTFFVGAHVRQGRYAETITHYAVLRTVEAIFGLSAVNETASAVAIVDVWQGLERA